MKWELKIKNKIVQIKKKQTSPLLWIKTIGHQFFKSVTAGIRRNNYLKYCVAFNKDKQM